MILAGLAGPVRADDRPVAQGVRMEPRGPTAQGIAAPASAPAPVTVLAMPAGAGVRISRAADGEGAPVSVIALETAEGRGGAGRLRYSRSANGGFGYRNHPILGAVRFHAGIDIARATGTRIIASSNGLVVQAGWAGSYGLLVTVDHGGGVQTRYAHLSAVSVRPGQRIRRGDVLGSVGSTGRSTGPHLHYEVRRNGRAVNPLPARKGN